MEKTLGINLFDYLDYRLFLKDWYRKSKEMRRGFSFRNFSKKAGFGSPNFLKRVMEGTRNLSEESVLKCGKGLSLNKQEQEFFRNLVFFNQASSLEEKDRHYRLLVRSRKLSQLKPIQKDQYEYYSSWHHAVIRELIALPDFDGSAENLTKRLKAPMTVAQIEHSIQLMERLGFIEKIGEGRWRPTSTLVTSGPEAASLVMRNYHDGLLEMIRQQMGKVEAQERDISALTLGVRRERIPEIKRKIQEFRIEILKMVAEETEVQEVVMLTIQFLPVTNPLKEEKK